ncbi:MAG: DegV family protein [Enterococcus sp.]|nr:DegV family protein [Enterococcus sp.]
MRKLKIVTDSSSTMDPLLAKELEISIVPLSVMINGVIYNDDETLGGEKFMTLMAQAKELPKTSQPPIGKFVELYDELGQDGCEILSIHMTKALSGTVDAARQASQLSKTKVTVIDSDLTDQSLAFAVIKAAEMAKEGYSLPEVVAEVKKILSQSKLYIAVSSLDNLVKGGRISRAKGVLSSFLNMRIVMELRNAELIPIVKGRGSKTFDKWFVDFQNEIRQISNIQQVGISYAGAATQAQKFKDELKKNFPQLPVTMYHTTPIIATHTGEGAFAVMYYFE